MINTQQMEQWIGQVLRWGLFLSLFIVLVGGACYLWQHGNDVIPYQVFSGKFTTILLSPQGIIQLGLFILIGTQVLRVILTAFLFLQCKDYVFTAISGGIFVLLIYSIFWGKLG